MIYADNFNDIYKSLINEVLMFGKEVSPRNIPSLELTAAMFQLVDISKSLLTLKERGLSYAFNVAEKLCYITGNSGEEILPKFAPNITRFLNPKTKKFDGAYGPRFIKQYTHVLKLLKDDPDTRQALLNIYNFKQDQHESLDVPCTSTLQFFIRDNKLNLIVYMRSNDLLWGTPYDVSQFTFIQECFARILGVENGTYTHIAGSLHIYEKDKERFEKILQSNEIVDPKYHQLQVDIASYEELQHQAWHTLHDQPYDNSYTFNNLLTPYFSHLHQLLWKKK